MSKYLFTPFDGQKAKFNTLSEACRSLGLNEQSIRVMLNRKENKGKPVEYIWPGGKLEKL